MKLMNALAIAGLAVVAATLVACGKTKNDSNNASTPAALSCTRAWDGTMRDQYGRSCGGVGYTGNNCGNARYVNGQYYDPYTNQPISCGGFYDGYNSIPYQGQYGGQYVQGCSGWTQIYGAYYVPVDLGNGQLICMNTQYLYNQMPQYNWNQAYYYQQPIYTCQGYGCQGGGGYYGYGCQSSFNVGFDFGYGNANFGMCF